MKLKIGKRVYTVTYPETLEPPLTRGRINYTKGTIEIAKRAGAPRRTRSLSGMQHTFWHEVVHGMLHDMGSRKYKDEVFVDELAKRIVQVHRQVGELND